MSHNELLNLYKGMFGDEDFAYGLQIELWFPNGKDSIRVRYTNKTELVFTYHDRNNWKLETLNEFIKSMKGGKK